LPAFAILGLAAALPQRVWMQINNEGVAAVATGEVGTPGARSFYQQRQFSEARVTAIPRGELVVFEHRVPWQPFKVAMLNIEGRASRIDGTSIFSVRKVTSEERKEPIDRSSQDLRQEVKAKGLLQSQSRTRKLKLLWDTLWNGQFHSSYSAGRRYHAPEEIIIDGDGNSSWSRFFKVEHFPIILGVIIVGIIYAVGHSFLADRYPIEQGFNFVTVFVLSVIVGVAFAGLVFKTLGSDKAETWVVGYILELVFSMENVFPFLAVVEGFECPAGLISKSLINLVFVQIIFQAILYLDLALWLESLNFLPYVLGLWLIFLGVSSVTHEHVPRDDLVKSDGHMHDMQVAVLWKKVLGDRLVANFHAKRFFVTHDKKWCCTLLLPMALTLVLTDFMMEADVTVTKIEAIDAGDEVIGWTSSAMAGFCLPPLFYAVRELFERYYAFKYSISFVLFFFGFQLLFENFGLEVPPLVSIILMLSAMALSIGISVALYPQDFGRQLSYEEESDASDANTSPSMTPRGASSHDRYLSG
jgi:tellurite resistance protein TerC